MIHNYININNPNARNKVLEMKEEYNLTDPFREINTEIRKYTWCRRNPIKQARLHYILVSENFHNSIEKVDIIPSYRSDHSPVVLYFMLNEFKLGKGL